MRTIQADTFAGLHDQDSVLDAIKKELETVPENERVSLSHKAGEALGLIASALPNMIGNMLADHNAKNCLADVVY